MNCQLTAIVTAYQRTEQTIDTIRRLQACQPPPAEILVHVDGNQVDCANAIQQAFPKLKILLSETPLGPGGGRNKLIAAASHEFVASFDDDSYPLDSDYFARVVALFERFPTAIILCAAVYHQGEIIAPAASVAKWVADFSGGGCVYRRTGFLATSGYVPLPVAYGMEEVDLAIRLHEQNGRVLHSTWLRVFHDTDLQRHNTPFVTSANIKNQALLIYLRYPIIAWLFGFAQLIGKISWLIRRNRRSGIVSGLFTIPYFCWQNRPYRKTVSLHTLYSYIRLRRASNDFIL